MIAGIVGSVASGVMQSKAAGKAANAQSAAADAQIAETRRQFDLVQGLLKPYVSAGTTGLQAQLDLMGLGGSMGTAPEIEEFTIAGSPQKENRTFGGNTVLGGMFGDQAPGPGTTKYRVNGREFADRASAQAYADSLRTGGISAADAQRNAISAIENGAQFGQLVKQGEYGILANQSATGGLRGGDTQAALAQFRPQMLQALIDKQLAQYGGLAANGQNAAAMTGTAAQNAGAQVNQALGDRGAAQAGAYLASGKAWSNAGSDILETLSGMATGTKVGPSGTASAWDKWTF